MARHTIYLTLATIFLLIGCQATKTNIVSKETSNTPLDKVMILAITNQYDVRSMWEKELGYRLRTKGFNTITSVGIDEKYKKMYTLDEIRELVKKYNLDGVITLKLHDIKQKESYTESDRYLSDKNVRGANPYYMYNYLDPYMNVYHWQYKMDQTVIIEGNLYDAKTEKLLFQTETQMTNAESDEALAAEITESLSIALRQSKLLKRREE